MNTVIDERLKFLEESRISHFNITKLLSGDVAPIDIYAFMVLKRSIALIFGFIELIRSKNFICAAPLIRLQIDNLIRFRAAFIVENQSQFVVDVIQEKEIRKLKDRSGKKMTDSYLQDVFEVEYPWLKDVYKNTSGYIHLSEKHFLNALRANEKDEDDRHGVLDVYIGPDDKMVSDEVYEGAVEDMIRVTHALITFMADWALNKNKPPAQYI